MTSILLQRLSAPRNRSSSPGRLVGFSISSMILLSSQVIVTQSLRIAKRLVRCSMMLKMNYAAGSLISSRFTPLPGHWAWELCQAARLARFREWSIPITERRQLEAEVVAVKGELLVLARWAPARVARFSLRTR